MDEYRADPASSCNLIITIFGLQIRSDSWQGYRTSFDSKFLSATENPTEIEMREV